MSVRRSKIARDLWTNKSRTSLVVLSIAVGVAAFGLMIMGRLILERNLTLEFADSNPAHSMITVSPFTSALLDTIRIVPEVEHAEGRHIMQARLETKPYHWLALEVHGITDFNNLTISRLKPQTGSTLPPPIGSILLERTIAEVAQISIGQKVRIQTLDGNTSELEVAGFVNDLAFQPTSISLMAYAYATLPTFEQLGEATEYNRLYITLKGNLKEREPIEQNISKVTTAIEEAGGQVLSAPVPPPGKQVMSDSMTSVLLILNVLGALTLGLSAFLIINIMSALITQQIPQIGILKSLGGRTGQLMRIYFELVLWFGIIGLMFAVPMGLFGTYFLVQGLSSAMNFDVERYGRPILPFALQVFGAIVVPLLAAAGPILTGSRITIREAISGNTATNVKSGFVVRSFTRFGQLSQLTRIAIGNTFRRKGRLLLTLAALSLAGAMFIALLGIRQSMRNAVEDIQASLNYDVSATLDRPYPLADVERAAKIVPAVTQIEGWGLADGRRIYDDGHFSSSIALIAVPPTTNLTQPTVTQGRWLQPDDDYVLFVNADALELAPDMAVGKQIKLRIGTDERLWRIVGVSARQFTPAAYIPYAAFEQVTSLKGQVSMVAVRTNDPSEAAQSVAQAALLDQFGKANITVTASDTTTELKKSSAASLDILVILLMVMVVLIAVVGGLGLAITMGLNVLERTREIGILRSLGATNGVIRRVVISESLVIGLISWLIGTALSIPLGMWLGNALGVSLLARPLDYIFSLPALGLWLVLICVIAVIASLIPANSAARLTIRDTLAYVG